MENKRESGAQAVGAVINRSLPRVFRIAYQLGEMERRWPNIVGPQLASCTQPDKLDKGVLIVACESPVAAQMINMSGGTLVMRVKRQIGLELPGVRAVVRRLEKKAPRPEPRPKKLTVPQSAVDEALAEVSKTIADPDLALSIARAQAAAKARFGKGRKKTEAAPQSHR